MALVAASRLRDPFSPRRSPIANALLTRFRQLFPPGCPLAKVAAAACVKSERKARASRSKYATKGARAALTITFSVIDVEDETAPDTATATVQRTATAQRPTAHLPLLSHTPKRMQAPARRNRSGP